MKRLTDTIYAHSQNLTDFDGGKKRGIFWTGRLWLHIHDWTIRFEWTHGKYAKFTRAMIELSGGDSGNELTFSLGLWNVFTHWITFDHPWFDTWMPKKKVRFPNTEDTLLLPRERQIGVRIFDKKIWISLWDDPTEWGKDDPWWWRFIIDVLDPLLGKEKSTVHENTEGGTFHIDLPERTYLAKYDVELSVFKRPRWPNARMVVYINVDIDPPIPVPGKGENSWDCEDDAICYISFCDAEIESISSKIIESVNRARLRYGGENWRPE